MQVVARTRKCSCWIVISVCILTDKGSTDVCSPGCVPSLRMGYTTSDMFIPEGKVCEAEECKFCCVTCNKVNETFFYCAHAR